MFESKSYFSVLVLGFLILAGCGKDSSSEALDSTELGFEKTSQSNEKESEPVEVEWDLYPIDVVNKDTVDPGWEFFSLSEISDEITEVFIAFEDKEFYSHNGFKDNPMDGLTISEQIVKKLLYNNPELRTTDRHVISKDEMQPYVKNLENSFSKEEILERYLNTVYFGYGPHGIQSAAKTFWGYDSVKEIDKCEAAMLAGIIRNPLHYNPTRYSESTASRRSKVLTELTNLEIMDQQEADKCNGTRIPIG